MTENAISIHAKNSSNALQQHILSGRLAISNHSATCRRTYSCNRLIPTLLLGVAALVSLTFLQRPAFAEDAKGQAQALSRAFEDVAKAVTPALVNISAETRPQETVRGKRPSLPPGLPEPFRDFFERFGEEAPFDNGSQVPHRGLGSGVIVDSKGHILTNNHVVAQADEVTVRLSDGREFEGEVIGADPRTDLAVVKIDAGAVQSARLGDSDKLKIGEWVVAAGTPFGLENTITAGIVSAKGRSIMGGNAYEDFIQTDAAINPGNSGGPLANLDGEVVGINTAIFSRSGGYMGIGFAIPINMAKSIMQSLISDGKVVRGWLGVVIQELTDELADSFEYEGTKGALVSEVAPDGPALKAGLLQGDIIISFNGKTVDTVNDLRNMVAAEKPSTDSTITVIRNGKQKRLTVTLGELPSNAGLEIPDSEEEATEPDYTSEIGISVETLSDELRKNLKAKAASGVVISGVEEGSLAADKGLRVGDVVKSINGKNVASAKEFGEVLEKIDLMKGARLLVESRGVDRFVFLKEKG